MRALGEEQGGGEQKASGSLDAHHAHRQSARVFQVVGGENLRHILNHGQHGQHKPIELGQREEGRAARSQAHGDLTKRQQGMKHDKLAHPHYAGVLVLVLGHRPAGEHEHEHKDHDGAHTLEPNLHEVELGVETVEHGQRAHAAAVAGARADQYDVGEGEEQRARAKKQEVDRKPFGGPLTVDAEVLGKVRDKDAGGDGEGEDEVGDRRAVIGGAKVVAGHVV